MAEKEIKETQKQYDLFNGTIKSEEEEKVIEDASENDEDIFNPKKTIRIAVSGDVILTGLEVKIIDTESFQRLRKFRQLGTSYLVYPSANHTRFEHSLGVLQKTQEMIDYIQKNQHSDKDQKNISLDQIRIARLAALLHDIANIPFGHTLEDETKVVGTYQEDEDRIKLYLDPDKEIGKILVKYLNSEDYKLLLNILIAEKEYEKLGENAFIADIIKNTVCADLLDYLARDTYCCNLPLSFSDRFLKYLYLHDDNGMKRLAIRLRKDKDLHPRPALVSELIQLLEIRYFLAERVYFHHAKNISSAMIASAVWYAMHQEKNALTSRKIQALGDDELISELSNSRYPISKKIIEDYTKRKLYKRVYSITRDEIESCSEDLFQYLGDTFHNNANFRNKIEMSLSDLLNLENGDIIIYCPDPDMNLKIAKMFVNSKRSGQVERFCDTQDKLARLKVDSIIESHKKLWKIEVYVKQGVLTSKYKEDLLYQWCEFYLKQEDIQSNDKKFRQAIRSTFNDIIREQEDNAHLSKIDSFVEKEIEECYRSGDFFQITREKLKFKIDKQNNTKT